MSYNNFDRSSASALATLEIDVQAENLIVHVTGRDGLDRQGDSWATVGPVSDLDRRPCVWNLQYRKGVTVRRDVDCYDEAYEDVDICGPLETMSASLREALQAACPDDPIELDVNFWALALLMPSAA